MDIFVGSLSFKLKESELREAFEKYGKVSSAKIIIDKITRQSKGFGFVEMPEEDEARLAISSMNGAEMYGRALVVNESQKREPGTAPRSDFKREGFSGPPRSSEGDSRPSSPPSDRPSGGYAGGSANTGGGGRDFGPDRQKGGDKKFSGGYGDRNKSTRPDNKFGRGTEPPKKGGGGSKNYKVRDEDEDDAW
ncbi:RNA-binding protein [Dyadobacter sp. CY323]|uniref:RNA recognition motif domain-containing protein n=1 Tax=Dyadobacter sp. CY323 TaxID=2907302 RepID=UPI001F40494B|nr:RNA-binding protein [Dyadobacter sp. CY323]MCE6990477.1 RNA-binding protein [Dyadobacter sp. CY323]